MTDPQTTCDPDSLDLFLGDKLADSERLVLEGHLEVCTACRDRLETLAAEPGLWSEAREFLSTADDLPELAGAHSSATAGS